MKERTRGSAAPGKAFLALAVLLLVSLACVNIPVEITGPTPQPQVETPAPGVEITQEAIPTFTVPSSVVEAGETPEPPAAGAATPAEPGTGLIPETGALALDVLFEQVNPGIVSIQIYTGRQGGIPTGAGSGFIIDDAGHIITNRHVVAESVLTTVVFYNGLEVQADVVGVDVDSDLAVLRVESLPEDTYPLPLGDSETVRIGEWVLAIGNPFGLAGSATLGIVSAVGRDIPTGATPFSIPQAIQTDAAINPGNSGGPLINMRGEIIGVNAQIATGGATAPGNLGVGFAIPSNIVRRVAPVLIEQGVYHWPWLGIEGRGVDLSLATANDLPTQFGAYIDNVIEGGPADQAGLRGSTTTTNLRGLGAIPAGGDVIIEADGNQIRDLSDLLVSIAAHAPGEVLELVVLRNGDETPVSVELAPRPTNFGNGDQAP